MKKAYLAAAAILGASLFAGEAHAVKIKLDKGKSFKMGFRAKVFATYKGKRNNDDKADLILSVPNARIYAKGKISKIFKWGFQADLGFNSKWYDEKKYPGGSPEVIDAFVMLDFAKEFKIAAGSIKLPFELHSGIQSGWSFLIPSGPAYGLGKANPFKNPAEKTAPRSGSRSPLVAAWGKVAGGLIKYYVGITDGTDEGKESDAKTGYFARVELTPVMAGYKGHPGYVLKESYLGKQNTLTLGLSYFSQDMGAKTATSFGVDLLWEQNFGAITPNISIGYVDHKNWKGKDQDGKGYLVQGQILFNQKTILGKPAVGFRWAQADPDGLGGMNDKVSVIGVVAQLYVKGVGNRIALTVDRVKDDNITDPNKKDSWTDVKVALWYSF